MNKKGSDYHIKSQSNNYLFKHMHGSDIYICNVPCVWVKYDINQMGMNARLDTIQAAILNVKINEIHKWNNRRIKIAEYYYLIVHIY